MTLPATASIQPVDSTSSSRVNTTFVALTFVSAYLELSLYAQDQLLFPNFGAFLVGLISIAYNRSAVRVRHIFLLILISLAIGTMTITANVINGFPVIENAASVAQLVVSLGTGYGVFLATARAGLRDIAYVFSGFLVLITVGAILELFGPVMAVSDYVRTLLYDSAVLYFDERRDIMQYGAIRPKFFAREPSLLGLNAGFAMTIAVLAAPNLNPRARIGIGLAIALPLAWIIRSPTMIFFFSVIVLGSLMLPFDRQVTHRFQRLLFSSALIFVLTAGLIATFLAARLQGPFADMVYGGSFYLRMVGPPLVALEAAQQAPIAGMGVGAYDQIYDMTRAVYASKGAFAYFPFLLSEGDARYLVTNVFWEFLIFFGWFGVAVMAFLFRNLLMSLGLRSVLFPFIAVAFAAQTFGGLAAFRFWYFLFTFAAIAYLAQRQTLPGAEGSPAFPPDTSRADSR